MGLKTNNYNVEGIGIKIPEAYAQITSLTVGMGGITSSVFEVQQSREDIAVKTCLEKKVFKCGVDKSKPIYRQVYEKAKESIFAGWEDDIVDE